MTLAEAATGVDTKVWIALIGILGTIVTAVIAGYAKLYSDSKKTEQALLQCEHARTEDANRKAEQLAEVLRNAKTHGGTGGQP